MYRPSRPHFGRSSFPYLRLPLPRPPLRLGNPDRGVTLICRPPVPHLLLGAFLHKTEGVLRTYVPLFCRPSVPLLHLGIVPRNASALVIHEAEHHLGVGVTLLG